MKLLEEGVRGPPSKQKHSSAVQIQAFQPKVAEISTLIPIQKAKPHLTENLVQQAFVRILTVQFSTVTGWRDLREGPCFRNRRVVSRIFFFVVKFMLERRIMHRHAEWS